MATQMGQRMVFENSKALINALGYSAAHAKLTQSYLRSEVALSTSVANYHIPVLVNDSTNGQIRVNERRLNLQDIFITTESDVLIGIGSSSATDAKLYSYPNPQTFTTSGAATALYSIYNGSLNLTINNEQVMPAWSVLRHLFVPQTQGGVGITAQTIFPIDQINFGEDASYPVEPGIVMNGAANINLQLSCSGAPAAIQANSFICVIQRGILCQNVTTVK
jgi:hypothetical protein